MSGRRCPGRGRIGGDRRRPLVAALTAVALLAAACGTGGETAGSGVTGSEGPPATTVAEATTLPSTTAAPSTGTAATGAPACTPSTSPTGDSTSTTGDASSTSTTAAPTTSITTTTIGTTTTTDPGDPVLASRQERLVELGYWLGSVDGRFGSMTAHAVTAFQKAEGLPRTGELDEATVARLDSATTPAARSTTGTVLEIDVTRQILLVVRSGTTVRIYDIATGAAATPTPVGEYRIYSEIDGYRYAPLGTLYRPKYFNGGIALHGYTSVPAQPASHGCVRLTYPAMDHLWASGDAPIGTTVLVYTS